MTSQELYEIVRKEIDARASTDPAFRTAQRNIEKGNGDFTDSAQCSRILSQILGEKLANHILELPPNSGRSEVCQRLLKDHFDEISRKFQQVQSNQDKKNGINLNTKIPKFPAERAKSVGGSLEDTTKSDETIQRRCRNAVSNVANAMHDDLIQENAKFRNDAGLLVKVTRIAGSDACQWCAEVAGTFTGYNAEVRQAFRRHDNCTCTITYTSAKTRSRLVGESDGAGGTTNKWVESQKSWQEKPTLPDVRPTRFTPEQAKRFETEQLRKQGLVRDGNGVKWVGNELTVPYDAVSGNALPQGQIARTFEELQRNAELVNHLLDDYAKRKSRWSRIAFRKPKDYDNPANENGNILGQKDWDCSITIREDAGIKTLIHELLHARSCSYYTREEFPDYRTMEEATVELYAQEICKKNGIPYNESYPMSVGHLRNINNILKIEENDFEFAKKLFDIDMKMRYNWLKGQIEKAKEGNKLSPTNLRTLNYLLESLRSELL